MNTYDDDEYTPICYTIKLNDITPYHLVKLDEGDYISIPKSDYGFGDIVCTNIGYEFFEIPEFGGESRLTLSVLFGQEEDFLKTIKSYT